MKTKHTKGEWFVSGGRQIVSMPSQCKISNSVSGWNIEEQKANCKLIAAAPELLEALNELNNLIERIDMRSKHDPYPQQIKAIEIIKKAIE